MSFNSFSFLLYLAIVAGLLNAQPASRTRRIILLVASYLFYASWNPLYLTLLVAVGVVAQRVAAWASNAERVLRARRAYSGVAILLIILVLFRTSVVLVPIRDAWVRATGIPTDAGVPLGLSFYVFEAISYLIEVGRGREKAYRFWDFQLFIAFFPHLLSGPIMKAKELIGQFDGARALQPRDVGEGLWKIASGLFLKIVLADELAAKLDPWFASPPAALHAGDVLAVGLGFGVQMYCDFAGYSRIAIGSGLLCGIRLIENFNHPFNAVSPSDFWNRWHISLSRWIRDYVFLPFVGAHRTLSRMCQAAIVSMVLCGLWHGFGVKFVVWGLFHGGVIGGYHAYRHVFSATIGPRVSASERLQRAYDVLGWMTTLVVLFPGWILFRAPSLDAAAGIFAAFGRLRGRAVEGSTYLHVALIFGLVVSFPLLSSPVGQLRSYLERFRAGRTAVDIAYGFRLAATIAVTMVYFGTSRSFVYFQF